MDKALTMRLLARDPGIPGSTVKQADERYFVFWRNFTNVPGRAPPALRMIPIIPELGQDEGGDGEDEAVDFVEEPMA